MSKLTEKLFLEWAQLPTLLKDQIDDTSEFFLQEKDGRLQKKLDEWSRNASEIKINNSKKYSKENEMKFFCTQTLIFAKVSALHVAKSEKFRRIQCYDDYGNGIIQLERIITNRKNVILFQGQFTDPKYRPSWYKNDNVVVKLFQSSDEVNTTQYEINQYRELGDPLPSLGINCYFWNIPVLVMMPMDVIGVHDDETDVGIQIIEQMEKVVHPYKPHSDIKPLNIMKIPKNIQREMEMQLQLQLEQDDHKVKNKNVKYNYKPIYTLIDYGGCPKIKRTSGIGWRRRTWSKKWTNQRSGTTITPKQDLLELGTTLMAMKWCRENDESKYPRNLNKIKPTGRIATYLKYASGIDQKNTINYEKHYESLINILRTGNVSGRDDIGIATDGKNKKNDKNDKNEKNERKNKKHNDNESEDDEDNKKYKKKEKVKEKEKEKEKNKNKHEGDDNNKKSNVKDKDDGNNGKRLHSLHSLSVFQ